MLNCFDSALPLLFYLVFLSQWSRQSLLIPLWITLPYIPFLKSSRSFPCHSARITSSPLSDHRKTFLTKASNILWLFLGGVGRFSVLCDHLSLDYYWNIVSATNINTHQHFRVQKEPIYAETGSILTALSLMDDRTLGTVSGFIQFGTEWKSYMCRLISSSIV